MIGASVRPRLRSVPIPGGLVASVPREPVVVATAATVFALAVLLLAARSAAVWFTPDGAHAVTDAWALVGQAPRTFYYLPGWPAVILPFLLAGSAPVAAVQAALALMSGFLFVALYALVRPWATPRAAFVGAFVATASTSVGELLGWQGGATLVGLVTTVAALAAFEQWARRGRRRDAIAVGIWFSLTLATHPFMAAVAAALLGLRWLAAVAQARRFSLRGWGPATLPGVVEGAAVPLGIAVLMASRYVAIDAPTGSGLRFPVPSATVFQLEWITREGPALLGIALLLGAVALAAPLGARAIAFGVVSIFALLPACLSGDVSYQSRVVYLLPILFAVGAAHLWQWVDARLASSPASGRGGRIGLAVAPLLVAGLVAATALPVRLPNAAAFYSRLDHADVALLSSLHSGSGTIVTSWTGNRYWDGMAKSWYVEGLSNRAAIGPTDPAMSTRPNERADSAAAWQLFSGERGVENGALQVALGPSNWRADPAIAARIGGYYIPLVYLNDVVNQYGPSMAGASPLQWQLQPDGSAVGGRSVPAGTALTSAMRLASDRVELSWTRGTADDGSAWTIWVWPSYGLPWRDVQVAGQRVTFAPVGSAAVRSSGAWQQADPHVTVSVTGTARLAYVERDPRFGLQAIAITVAAGSSLAATVQVSGTPPAGATSTYDERTLIRDENVTGAVVWRDTGWLDRFEASDCFHAGAADARIATFEVDSSCRAR